MSNEKPSNIAAFPSTVGGVSVRGMTLRDWFAGQALAGYCSIEELAQHCDEEVLSDMAYAQADAMLKSREDT